MSEAEKEGEGRISWVRTVVGALIILLLVAAGFSFFTPVPLPSVHSRGKWLAPPRGDWCGTPN